MRAYAEGPDLKENLHMNKPRETITISKEDAVFWLDAEGRWHNEHGPFEHPRISAYFHACIQRDADGYFVGQERDAVYEKVYFRYADTALFVFGVEERDRATVLRLNTGQTIDLQPADLFVRDDHLYTHTAMGPARFNQKSLMQIARRMEEQDGELCIRVGDARFKVPETDQNPPHKF